MFTKDALIMTDSLELRGMLADMGYKMVLKDSDTYAALLTTKKCVVGMPLRDEYPDGEAWTLEKFLEGNPQIENCGENRELFIALSALADNSCQLYRWVIKNDTGEWIQLTQDNIYSVASYMHRYSFPDEYDIICKFKK